MRPAFLLACAWVALATAAHGTKLERERRLNGSSALSISSPRSSVKRGIFGPTNPRKILATYLDLTQELEQNGKFNFLPFFKRTPTNGKDFIGFTSFMQAEYNGTVQHMAMKAYYEILQFEKLLKGVKNGGGNKKKTIDDLQVAYSCAKEAHDLLGRTNFLLKNLKNKDPSSVNKFFNSAHAEELLGAESPRECALVDEEEGLRAKFRSLDDSDPKLLAANGIQFLLEALGNCTRKSAGVKQHEQISLTSMLVAMLHENLRGFNASDPDATMNPLRPTHLRQGTYATPDEEQPPVGSEPNATDNVDDTVQADAAAGAGDKKSEEDAGLVLVSKKLKDMLLSIMLIPRANHAKKDIFADFAKYRRTKMTVLQRTTSYWQRMTKAQRKYVKYFCRFIAGIVLLLSANLAPLLWATLAAAVAG